MASRANSYCSFVDVKSRLSGDGVTMSPAYDQVIADKCLEVSRDLDRMISRCRGIKAPWSFLADTQYDAWLIAVSTRPPVTEGTFTLTFGGEETSPIFVLATAADLVAALESLGSVGSGNVAVTGRTGGPWRISWSGGLIGAQGDVTTDAAGISSDLASVVAQRMVTGVDLVTTERIFVALPDEILLPIDDCVEITQVRLVDGGGSTISVLGPSDYRAWPYSGSPYEALKSSTSAWAEWPTSVAVTARWGYATEITPDVREAAIIETIRSYISDRAGNDDRVGVTPLGSIMMSKSYTSKTNELLKDYAPSFGLFR